MPLVYSTGTVFVESVGPAYFAHEALEAAGGKERHCYLTIRATTEEGFYGFESSCKLRSIGSAA